MVDINYMEPDPENGIFGCIFGANEYSKAVERLPKLDDAIASLSQDLDSLLKEASSVYYTSGYGPSGPFRTSAGISLDKLEMASQRISLFTADIRANILRERQAATNSISFFLSYSHKDSEFATRLAKDLRKSGHTVWRDDDNIRMGESIRRAIESGIKNAKLVLIVVSSSSLQSAWCQNELDMALANESADAIKILPIIIDDCEVPMILRGRRYFKFSHYKRDIKRFISLIPVCEDT